MRIATTTCVAITVTLGFASHNSAQDTVTEKTAGQEEKLDYESTQEEDKKLYERGKLKPGARAPDIQLTPLTKSGVGRKVQLSSLYKDRPLVVVLGSCTCGMTKDNLPQLKEAYEKFGEQANFAFIYMKDAHPSPGESVAVDGQKIQLVQPKSMDHRIKLAKHLINDTSLSFPVYIDDMNGTARKSYEGFHNSAYVIDTHGRFVYAERYKYKAADVVAALTPLLKSK